MANAIPEVVLVDHIVQPFFQIPQIACEFPVIVGIFKLLCQPLVKCGVSAGIAAMVANRVSRELRALICG